MGKVLATQDPRHVRPQVLSASTWDHISAQSCMEWESLGRGPSLRPQQS